MSQMTQNSYTNITECLEKAREALEDLGHYSKDKGVPHNVERERRHAWNIIDSLINQVEDDYEFQLQQAEIEE